MTLGESIYYYRKRSGMSQEALAERVGVSRQAVSRWELGDTTPEVGKLMALAEAFGITTDQLLSGKEPKEPSPGEGPVPNSEWDKLPGFLARMIRRHGWLAGVYIALQGLGGILVGGVARFAFGRMFRVAADSFQNFGGFGGWGISAVDSAGNAIELPPEALEQLMEQVGGGAFGSGQVTAVSGAGEVFMTIATVIMVIGLLTAIAGTILAVILYRKGRKEA